MHPRHSVILELVNERGRIAVVELAEQVGVSEVTVRQDLNYLEDQGFLKRIHGAATRVDSDDPDHRLWARSKIKLHLAEKAASLVAPGETVLIEGGSANAILAKLLGERGDTAIITSSSYIAHQLRQARSEVILLGGQYQATSESLVGPLTRLCIQHVHFSKAFIGVDGFHVDTGFTNRNMMRADVANSILAKGQENIILTDSSKFGRIHPGSIGPLTRIKRVITDTGLPAEDEQWLRTQGVDVLKTN
ncbi:MAG: DNA-binding transcriptional regulator YciT [Aeromonadaceae bacterium]